MDFGELERRLLGSAFLFDDPTAYAAGVADALGAVRRALERERQAAGAMDTMNAASARQPAAAARSQHVRPIRGGAGRSRPARGAI